MLRVILLLLAAVALPCFAQTDQSAELTCSAPTTYVDGSPISGAISYRFYRGDAAGGPYERIGESQSCVYVDEGLARGKAYFWVATAVVGGVESDPSNEASKTTANPVPSAPGNLTVGEDLTAYTPVLSRDRVAYVPVGQVAPDAPCDASQPLGRFHVVPRELVTWASSTQPAVVVAECG